MHYVHITLALAYRSMEPPFIEPSSYASANDGSAHTLVCVTPKRPCCKTSPYHFGEWFYPSGSVVSINGSGNSFYTDRGMMEQFTFTGEGLLHCQQPWASTVVKFQTLTMLSIDFVYISVSSLNCTKFVSVVNYYTCCKQYS